MRRGPERRQLAVGEWSTAGAGDRGPGPELGRSSVPAMASRVDLPEPEGPTIATSSPVGRSLSVTARRAATGGTPAGDTLGHLETRGRSLGAHHPRSRPGYPARPTWTSVSGEEPGGARRPGGASPTARPPRRRSRRRPARAGRRPARRARRGRRLGGQRHLDGHRPVPVRPGAGGGDPVTRRTAVEVPEPDAGVRRPGPPVRSCSSRSCPPVAGADGGDRARRRGAGRAGRSRPPRPTSHGGQVGSSGTVTVRARGGHLVRDAARATRPGPAATSGRRPGRRRAGRPPGPRAICPVTGYAGRLLPALDGLGGQRVELAAGRA